MTKEHFPYDRTVRELMLHIPKRFTEILFGLNVVEVLDPNFPKTEESYGLEIGTRITRID